MKYILTQSQKKITRAGKPFIRASLKDDRGNTFHNVSIWSNFPGFNGLRQGDELAGSVETNAQGYKNLRSLETSQSGQGEVRDMRVVRSGEDYRSEIIRLAQDRKNESIAYFNATNAAIELVSRMPSKLMSTVNRSILKQEIAYWREWFLEEWKKHDTHTRYA